MAADPANAHPTALIVDDDAQLRMDVTEMLETVGFRSLEAADSDTAIVLLDEHHPDVTLLFSDVEMPGSRDGFGLAREVASRWPTISIVISSGRLAPAEGDMPDGAHFIAKPFSAEVVHGHLRKVVPEHQKPAELR